MSWSRARAPLAVFVGSFLVLAGFSGPRFSRQSGAPHFVYQARAWLEGRLDIDARVLPNLEDWACVRDDVERKARCEGAIRSTDRWYVSFPPFPAVLMLPFVAIHGYQLNDTSWTVAVAALSLTAFAVFLRRLSESGSSERTDVENWALAALLGFGTLFFYCAIRGEVWFTAEILGVGLTALYLTHALEARAPIRAGIFYAMATLTRTPLLFSGVFFVLEAWRTSRGSARATTFGGRLASFALGAAPLALPAAIFNFHRFGALGEFGHRFLYNNRVNADIDRYGLFHPHYLARNLEAAWLKLPRISWHPFQLGYDPHGLSLLLTLPWLPLLLSKAHERPSGVRGSLWAAVALCALPGFFYQNTGYAQFGFRFSLDYTPYLVALLAVSSWSFKSWLFRVLAGLGLAINLWGALIFRGYTEYLRR